MNGENYNPLATFLITKFFEVQTVSILPFITTSFQIKEKTQIYVNFSSDIIPGNSLVQRRIFWSGISTLPPPLL